MITVQHKHELQEAIIHDDVAKIEHWIAAFPPFLKTRFFIDKVLYTPLQLALKHNKMNALQTLLRLGTPVTADDLVDSSCDGMEKYFDAVISHATGINCKTYDRHFALEQAAISRNPYFVKTLLERGANPNLKNNWGATALHRAVECCNFAVIPLLLQADTDTTIADRHGLTALNMAEESDIHEIIKMFDDDAERRKQEQKLRIKKIAADSITVKEDIVPPTVTLSPVRRQMKL